MFDNIRKFIAENFSDDLATWLLGSPLSLTVREHPSFAMSKNTQAISPLR